MRLASWHHWRRILTAGVGITLAGITIAASTPSRSAQGRAPRTPARILVLYDMEGASGVLSGATMDPAKQDSFAVGRASLITDVNAVIAGLYDAGVTHVDVKNMHGAGGDTLVPRDRLDKRAGIITGQRTTTAYVMDTPNLQQSGTFIEGPRPVYDAVVTVAMHDKPMSGGFSPHTLGMGISPIIDGHAVTETELVGFNFGTVGIPVIFASGDDRLGATLKSAMPWLEYVVVKRILSPTVPAPLPPDDVRRTLHDGAARAVREFSEPGRARAMRLPAEFRAGLLTSYPLLLPPGIGSLPGIQKRGDTVTFLTRDYRAAFWGMFVLQRIAAAMSADAALREIAESADSAVFNRAMDARFSRAKEFEAGKWKP